MEHQHGALLEGQPPEGPLELVTIVDGERLVGAVRALDGDDPDLGRPTPATPGLGVAGVGQDPLEPGLEGPGIAQRTKLPSRRDQRGLDRILGQVGIAQDPARDRHAPVADHAGKGVEGLSVAALCKINQCSLHPSLLAR